MKLVKDITEDPHKNQMSLISDTEEVTKFLELAGKKAILNEHTINCRMTACNNLFSILNEGEDNVKYMLDNLDLLVNRFRNKHSNVQASTLKVYKSRLKSSLEDYVSWSKDPLAWEKSVLEKVNASPNKDRKAKAKQKALPRHVTKETVSPAAPRETEARAALPATQGGRRVSFPIRSDFNVEMVIPTEGLSLKEMLRLGLFLFPYCKESESRDDAQAWSTILPHITN